MESVYGKRVAYDHERKCLGSADVEYAKKPVLILHADKSFGVETWSQ